MISPSLPFLLPWVRAALVARAVRTTAWDDATWPAMDVPLARALDMRRQLNREGRWN
jgi:hypothetical protein